ncbi:MAG TPA: ABC transporter permease [Nitrolancea sp.]|nr:ABC transporter permease [Nitrolancea sp.]
MTIDDAFSIAISALTANKLRTMLTMLGVIIGVSAVIALIAVGRGAQQQVTDRISGLGSNLLFIRPGASTTAGVRGASGSAATLTLDDSDAIQQNIPSVSGVAPEVDGTAQLSFQGQNVNTRIVGTTPDYQDVRNFHPADGTFFTDDDVNASSPVVVLGANVATELFGTLDPVGQEIRLSRGATALPFQVLGVMESKGGTALGNQDDQVFIPITTEVTKVQVARTSNGSYEISTINVEVASSSQMTASENDITALLEEEHNESDPDFTIQSQEDTVATLTASTQTFTLLLGSIAAISLIVGGIGIMNIMLVSVTERTREIGIRKAMGARRQDILLQFLVESLTVSVMGGALGVALGIGVAHVSNGRTLGTETFYTSVGTSSVLMAFLVSACIGVFFGLYPAMRAASLNPIQALRYE